MVLWLGLGDAEAGEVWMSPLRGTPRAFEVESLRSAVTVSLGIILRDCPMGGTSLVTGSSDNDKIYSTNEVFTRCAACRTCSTSLAMAGNTCDSRRGTKGRISSGQ